MPITDKVFPGLGRSEAESRETLMMLWQQSMKSRVFSIAFLFSLVFTLGACASHAPFIPERLAPPHDLTGVQTNTIEDVVVSVAILTDEQAENHFGVDIAKEGLQALWVKVRNGRNGRLWFIQNTIDPDIYTADEAALMMQGHVSEKEYERLKQHFRDESIRVAMESKMITEGFVFLPRIKGGRFVEVRLTGDALQVEKAKLAETAMTGKPSQIKISDFRFSFALPLPDGEFDYEKLDPAHSYSGMDLPDLDLEQLRDKLEQLPCCATDASGENNADPLNIVMVAEPIDLMNSLSRSGWSFTHRITPDSVGRMIDSAIKDKSYPVAPVSSLYVFDRKHDVALQRARTNISQRNHMRFWLAPFTHRGRKVWVGQISRDIGIKLSSKSPSLTTHIIDPEIDLAREYLLHSLLAQGFVAQFGFVAGSKVAPRSEPATNLTGDPYFSDGLRLVIMLSPEPIPLVEIRSLLWEESSAPVAASQSEEAGRYVRPVELEPED